MIRCKVPVNPDHARSHIKFYFLSFEMSCRAFDLLSSLLDGKTLFRIFPLSGLIFGFPKANYCMDITIRVVPFLDMDN